MPVSRRCGVVAVVAGVLTVLGSSGGAAVAAKSSAARPSGNRVSARPFAAARPADPRAVGGYKHLVVIYEENHSFDNLFGGWGSVRGQRVNGVDSGGYSTTATQAGQDGKPLDCLPQNDVNLTSPPLDANCGAVTMANGTSVPSHFTNTPFSINDYLAPNDPTCPPGNVSAPNGVSKQSGAGLPGGCTRDIVHRFYNEQFQLDQGKMDRYSLGSDAAGLTQGRYDTTSLPVYQYLHDRGAPNYVVADNFFQGAFGGSFLNHQFLISGRAPLWANWTPAAGQAHSVLDQNGMPATTPLYAN